MGLIFLSFGCQKSPLSEGSTSIKNPYSPNIESQSVSGDKGVIGEDSYTYEFLEVDTLGPYNGEHESFTVKEAAIWMIKSQIFNLQNGYGSFYQEQHRKTLINKFNALKNMAENDAPGVLPKIENDIIPRMKDWLIDNPQKDFLIGATEYIHWFFKDYLSGDPYGKILNIYLTGQEITDIQEPTPYPTPTPTSTKICITVDTHLFCLHIHGELCVIFADPDIIMN